MVEPTVPAESGGGPRRRPGWFFHPYSQLLLSIVLSAAAQLFLKKGSDLTTVPEIWMGFEALRSPWVWLGIVAMVASLFSWLYSLKFIALNVAYNLAGFIHVLVPLGSWLLLGEHIGPTRLCGILLVCVGVFVIAQPLMRAEEKL